MQAGYTCAMSANASKAIDWDKLVRLFVPGSGVEPPLLAGREEPLKKLADLVGYLQEDGRATPGDVVLFGPRGNGKTVLLGAFQEQCADIDTIALTPTQIGSSSDLAALLLFEDEGFRNFVKDYKSDRIGARFAGMFSEWRKMNQTDKDEHTRRHLVSLLTERCQHKPLVVTLDEAHTLDIEVGRLLLNASQLVRRNRAPFLLALAGTPNLRDHLGLMSATFRDRAEIISVGRLDSAATRAALLEPLKGFEVSVEDDALETVSAESQHYPYFIQAWGKALCLALRDSRATHIDRLLVDAARPIFSERRTDYYEKRYEELARQDLVESARAVSAMFQDVDVIDSEVLKENLVAALALDSQGALDALRKLSHLGFTWKPPARTYYEPGIPSLMDYVLTGRQWLCS